MAGDAVVGADRAIRGLSEKVLRYFREFLESDFKRLQAPRRRILLKTQAGFRCAIDLRKYPSFFKDAWALMEKPPQEMRLQIGRRRYRAQISPILKNLVDQYANQLTDQSFEDVRRSVIANATAKRSEASVNPETWVERVVAQFGECTAAQVVHPLLSLLEGSFKEAAYSAEDSIFEVEADLTDALCAGCAEHMPEALNTLLLTGDKAALERVMSEFFSADALRAQVVEFFEAFVAADAYQELRDVLNYAHSDDTLTTYLYLGAIKFGPNEYPLLYLPVTLTPQADSSGYEMSVEPRLFVHKQAIEYIVGEMRQQAERVGTAVVAERIIHLAEDDTAQARILKTTKELERTFDVFSQVDFREPRPQVARNPQLRLTNSAWLAAFDRSDESLVNDYEALLSSLEADHQEAASMFHGIVKSMLFEDPVSVTGAVRAEWASMTPAQRLVTSSPIPLNEEQIRIDAARRQPGCRFIAVEGPPGTGKSHTITALAFNAIMDHQSVLIVSDKNEALEVVQDKLEQALAAVRHGDEFPNPILRLGKDGTYRSLISGSSRVKIENHFKAQTANMPNLERELTQKTRGLAERIGKTVEALTAVDMAEIARFHALEAHMDALSPGLGAELQRLSRSGVARTLGEALAKWTPEQRKQLAADLANARSLEQAVEQAKIRALVAEVSDRLGADAKSALRLFRPLKASQLSPLMSFVARIKALRMPLFGYLFRGGALAKLDADIAQALPCPNPVGLSRKMPELEAVANVLGTMGATANRLGLEDASTAEAYGLLLESVDSGAAGLVSGADTGAVVLGTLRQMMHGSFAAEVFSRPVEGGMVNASIHVAEFIVLGDRLTMTFASVPQVNFVDEKGRLETLNTARLANRLDSRFLDFAENNRATAQALGGVIKQRAQFPTEQFKTLRDAFPCVIAGIRELGEFVPLKTHVFDLLVIDEGSQVSVAQAIPAMLRAKQVVIFGDRRQFSNVKSAHASNVTNASYLSDLKDHFRSNVSGAVDKLDRLVRFDVKRSVLDFGDLVASHSEMLRKHFRGYPELISYSSKHFYNGALQAIKVRPVPIEDVIRFEVVEHDGRAETKRNTNGVEAEHILAMLEEMLQSQDPPSVGIITPHTEQAAYLSSLVVRHPLGERFDQQLRLKIMTFDSCQGEERDVIVYSMVATRQRDVLNYIFPVEFKKDEDENDTLKAQRLNVGFSRAKEAMVFVLSKQPEDFRGTIGGALMHYKRILTEKVVAEDGDTDARSPMERKLLQWLKATPFVQMEADRIEVIAQFPVGDYLKQLDATYQHPAYKADFLLRHYGQKTTNVLVEYDGFEYHFSQKGKVHGANYEWYYRPEDVERQFVLESYGYRFLRVNRFNLGSDPVATLDQRLREMIPSNENAGPLRATRTQGGESSVVEKIKAQAQALDNKEAKACGKCNEVKDKEAFFDSALAGGKGGYGRICMTCKTPAPRITRGPGSNGWAGYGSRY